MGQDWASSEWFSLNEALDTVPLCNNDSYLIPGKHSVCHTAATELSSPSIVVLKRKE